MSAVISGFWLVLGWIPVLWFANLCTQELLARWEERRKP